MLSARMDGEDLTGVDEVELTRHLAECSDCAAFRAALAEHGPLLRGSGLPEPPDLSAAIMAAATRRRAPIAYPTALRIGIVVMAVAELVSTLYFFLREHGYGGEDHAGHESLSFTVAVCVGMVWIARRPAYARGYLPMLGVAVTLLVATAALDVEAGRAELAEELPHLNLLVAFVLLWLLVRTDRDGGRPERAGRAPAPAGPERPRLHAVPRSVRRTGVVALAAAVVATVVLVAAPAWGHATLEGSDPGPGVTLPRVPGTVSLRFDESVTTLPTSVRVFGPSGDRVDTGVVTHPGGAGSRIAVGVRGGETGTYLVAWRVVSADSHPVSGAFTFSVGRSSAAPTAPGDDPDRAVGVLLGATRWGGYAGAALLIGGSTFLLRCWPAGWAHRGAARLPWIGVGATAIATVGGFLLKGPYDAALGAGHVLDSALLREVAATTYGRALLARLALLVLAGGVLLLLGRRATSTRRALHTAAAVAVGAALAATFALAGHASADDPRALALGVDSAHVAAMAVWLGGLAVLVLVVLRAGGAPEALVAVRRFSPLALAAVVVLVGTGSYQAWRRVGAWGALPHTTYGRELLVKVGLVVLVVAAAAYSRRWTRAGGRDTRLLRRSVGAEAVGAVAVLALTAALVATTPADKAYHPDVQADLRLGPDLVQVSAVPAGDRRMQVHLYVFDKDSQPVDPQEIDGEVTLPDEHLGPLAVPLSVAGTGHRIGTLAVPLAGTWTLTVSLRTSAIDEYRGTVRLPIR